MTTNVMISFRDYTRRRLERIVNYFGYCALSSET